MLYFLFINMLSVSLRQWFPFTTSASLLSCPLQTLIFFFIIFLQSCSSSSLTFLPPTSTPHCSVAVMFFSSFFASDIKLVHKFHFFPFCIIDCWYLRRLIERVKFLHTFKISFSAFSIGLIPFLFFVTSML